MRSQREHFAGGARNPKKYKIKRVTASQKSSQKMRKTRQNKARISSTSLLSNRYSYAHTYTARKYDADIYRTAFVHTEITLQ